MIHRDTAGGHNPDHHHRKPKWPRGCWAPSCAGQGSHFVDAMRNAVAVKILKRPPLSQPSNQTDRDFVYLAPPQLGLGDQLCGLTTAVWLARVLRRPLKVCDDLNGIIALPRATSAQCAQWTEQFHDKQFKYNLSMTQNDTMFVGCHQSKYCSDEVRTGFPGSDPSKSRRVRMITRENDNECTANSGATLTF